MATRVTKHAVQYDTMLNQKQWEVRNRVAKHLLSNRCTDITRLESMGSVAKAMGSDPSSLRRVLEKAPGFVLVRHATLNNGLRTAGVFYDTRFLSWAVELDPSHCYPLNLFELSKGIMTRGLEVPMEIVLDDPSDVQQAVAVPDAGIAAVFSEAGITHEALVNVPVAGVAAITYEQAVTRFNDGLLTPEQFIAHFVSRYWKNKQQEEIS